MTVVAALHVALLVVSVVTTALLGRSAWRNREIHGAKPFFGLMIAFTLYSGAHLGGLLTFRPRPRLAWEVFQWAGAAAIPVFWLLFAYEYTGYGEAVTWRGVVVLSVVPVVSVLLVGTNHWHGLVWADSNLTVTAGLSILDQTFGPWFWVFLFYTYGLLLIGSFLLIRHVWMSDYLYTDQAALLVVGLTVPIAASALTVLDATPIRDPTLDITPYTFSFSGAAFGYALFRRRLFELIPATRQVGRIAAVRDLEDGVVIVDTTSTIVYCNPAAARLLDREPEDMLDEPVGSVIDDSVLDPEGDPEEWERGERVYEVRSSPIDDAHDRTTGYTLVLSDVTARKRREDRIKRQRDELARLDDLNKVIRGVNRTLVSARTREEIERTVAERLAESDLYRAVCIADIPTWEGSADRWTVTTADGSTARPPQLNDGIPDPDDRTATVVAEPKGEGAGHWTLVPITYGRTVYGAIGLSTSREPQTEDGALPSREREVLGELGDLIGHSINAIENQQLLSAEIVIELEFGSDNEEAPMVRAAAEAGSRLSVTGVVLDGSDEGSAYVRVEAGDPERVADALGKHSTTPAEPVSDDLVEWELSNRTTLGALAGSAGTVTEATAEDGFMHCVVEVPSEADIRLLIDRVQEVSPDTWLEAKRERSRSIEASEDLADRVPDDLTDRQREVLEVAYRKGYFEWPRENDAENIADGLDIAAPTFLAHLRKAEGSLAERVFDTDD